MHKHYAFYQVQAQTGIVKLLLLCLLIGLSIIDETVSQVLKLHQAFGQYNVDQWSSECAAVFELCKLMQLCILAAYYSTGKCDRGQSLPPPGANSWIPSLIFERADSVTCTLAMPLRCWFVTDFKEFKEENSNCSAMSGYRGIFPIALHRCAFRTRNSKKWLVGRILIFGSRVTSQCCSAHAHIWWCCLLSSPCFLTSPYMGRAPGQGSNMPIYGWCEIKWLSGGHMTRSTLHIWTC